jgi:uncharacterized protein YbjQ (UPF0145 family)
MLVVTTENIPGYKIIETKGIVQGACIKSRSVFGNMFGNLKAMFGGNQDGYIKLVIQTRDEAIQAMINEAQNLNANAIIMMRFDSNEFDSGQGQSMSEVVAYGTAVIIEKI